MPKPISDLKRLADRCTSENCLIKNHKFGRCATCGGKTAQKYHHNCDKCWEAFVAVRSLHDMVEVEDWHGPA